MAAPHLPVPPVLDAHHHLWLEGGHGGSPAYTVDELHADIATGPANTKAVALMDKALLADMPTTPENIANQVPMDVVFWADYGEQLEQRFNAWAAK